MWLFFDFAGVRCCKRHRGFVAETAVWASLVVVEATTTARSGCSSASASAAARSSPSGKVRYSAVASGQVDVISAFSTDGRISAFDLVVLEDTRGALPPYDAIVLTSARARERAPGLHRALSRLDGAIDAETMRRANRQVDLEGKTIADAVAILAAQLSP